MASCQASTFGSTLGACRSSDRLGEERQVEVAQVEAVEGEVVALGGL